MRRCFTRRKPAPATAYGLMAALLIRSGCGWDLARLRRAAERARGESVLAGADAERPRETFERFEFGPTVEVPHQEWRRGDVPVAPASLDGTRNDLRGGNGDMSTPFAIRSGSP